MTDIKELIERAKSIACDTDDKRVIAEITDALESLTQPVGLEPVAYYLDSIDDGEVDREYSTTNKFSCGRTGGVPLFTEAQLRQVMAERDDLQEELKHFRDNARPAFIRQANDQNKITALQADNERLQSQVAMLRKALNQCKLCVPPAQRVIVNKALAATEPKESK